MPDQGSVTESSKTQIKMLIIGQLREHGAVDPERLEQNTFHVLTGHSPDEIDFDDPANEEGYQEWQRTFQQLVAELTEDGRLIRERSGDGDVVRLSAAET